MTYHATIRVRLDEDDQEAANRLAAEVARAIDDNAFTNCAEVVGVSPERAETLDVVDDALRNVEESFCWLKHVSGSYFLEAERALMQRALHNGVSRVAVALRDRALAARRSA